MKSKQQKRLEAIERLERTPRNYSQLASDFVGERWARRKVEAKRLRAKFNLEKQQ